MIVSIASPDFHKMLYIIALLNGSFENNFIFRFTFLNQSNTHMKPTIIDSTTNLIFTDFIFWNFFLQLYYHWIFTNQRCSFLADKKPCFLFFCRC